jgi:hypothetical protein
MGKPGGKDIFRVSFHRESTYRQRHSYSIFNQEQLQKTSSQWWWISAIHQPIVDENAVQPELCEWRIFEGTIKRIIEAASCIARKKYITQG